MPMQPLVIGDTPLALQDVADVAIRRRPVALSETRAFRERIALSRRRLQDLLAGGHFLYGVTTGFGKSCGNRFSGAAADENGINLLRFHGCGTGEPFGIEETRAAMVCRLASLASGYSGVSWGLLESLAAFLNRGITPVVPAEGSVGASGDLTPLSYVAAALGGEREVWYGGQRMPADRALAEGGVAPHVYEPKEPLAMMNGTSMMTGVAVLVCERAFRLQQAAEMATALTVHALLGHAHHFDPILGQAKPHPGQIAVAEAIRSWLQPAEREPAEADAPETLQDPYSVRCAPQALGVLADALAWIVPWVETEINSANDNPLIDPLSGRPLLGGNFYGGHIAFAMDALKTALASAADLSDRQVALLVDPQRNRDLPADLVRLQGEARLRHHGFKALSIAASALAAEALKNTMPAGSFSRSTESHNQDKVSMGTIAARDAARVALLGERVAAIHLLAAAQACEIRGTLPARPRLQGLVASIRVLSPPLWEDRPLDREIEALATAVRAGQLSGRPGENGEAAS